MSRIMELTPRFFPAPKDHFFLFGPRGTGKTSWVRSSTPEMVYVDLLEPETHRLLQARPERLRELVEATRGRVTIVVDEVQKNPVLLDVIHQLIEADRRYRFILTGSSARTLRRSGVNLLGGRAVVRNLHPFMAAELGVKFSLPQALRHGLVPVMWGAEDPEDRAKAYADLYLREEVMAEGLVRNIGSFARFLETMSFSQASVVNLANVARESGVNRKTVEGYLDVLEDLLLAFRIPVFSKKASRAMAVHPKFYIFDVGVFCSLRPRGPLDTGTDIEGIALETLVAQHARAWCDYSRGDHRLHFWRTRSGVEVDFVIYGAHHFVAIEVKNTRTVRPEDLRGLKAFGADYPQAMRLFLYRGKDRIKKDGILCVPCEEFLRGWRPDEIPD